MSRFTKLVLGISASETSFQRRGFRGGENGARERFERIGSAFAAGYHAVLLNDRPDQFVPELKRVEAEFRGFAFEGAAMGLALLDRLTPWRRDRIERFLSGEGRPYSYLVHVGVGWAMARFPGSIEPGLRRMDPILGWLALDGYGFHEGYFHWPKCLADQPIPRRVKGYGKRVFDQGLGRSLWFVEGANVARLKDTLEKFSEVRRADLWSGIGLASVYAGELNETDLGALVGASGRFHPQLAQGAAFAAKARMHGGNPTAYTECACRSLCGMSAQEAANLTDAALDDLPAHSSTPAYELWRVRVQDRFC